jgi:hypothetical protein
MRFENGPELDFCWNQPPTQTLVIPGTSGSGRKCFAPPAQKPDRQSCFSAAEPPAGVKKRQERRSDDEAKM